MPRGVYDHSHRTKHRTPEAKKAAHSAAVSRYRSTPKGKCATQRTQANTNAKNWRHRTTAREKRGRELLQLKRAGLSLLSEGALRRPPLYYIDRHGVIRHEDTRSAEQLIADFCSGRPSGRQQGEHKP
jgi:hypothetical protein